MVTRAVGSACVLFCGACQSVSGVDDLEIQFGPDWACLESDAPSSAYTFPSGVVNYEGSVRNLAGEQPLETVRARVCRTDDELCDEPLSTIEVTDGVLRFSVDASFDGYIELESPGLMNAIVELTRPIGAMRALSDLRMVPLAGLQLYAVKLGATIDDSLGHLLYWTEDCSGTRAKGVSVRGMGDLSPNTLGYYVIDTKFPAPDGTVNETDESGAGGFINLPTTFPTFEARLAQNQAFISLFGARIRAGHTTFVVIEPD